MDRIADAVILSWGWRRRGIGFAAGALSALALPPFFFFPILWLTFPVLVWLLDGAVGSSRRGGIRRVGPAFAVGWWFGFGYFLAGLWWVGAAFLVDAPVFGWLMPFAILALTAGLALFWGVGTAAAQILWSGDWRRIFALAGTLGAAEWLRGHILTGFPWNTLGYALTSGEVLMQSASLIGVYGLTVVAVLVFAAPATLAPAGTRGRNRAAPAAAVLLLAALALFGVLRLGQSQIDFIADTRIRIAQPALSQDEKSPDADRDTVLALYRELSLPDGSPIAPGTILVWPETAFPFALTEDREALALIADILPTGTTLVTGAYRVEAGEDRRVFNSIYMIDAEGTIVGAYDKVHLVPFGEYLPLGNLFDAAGFRPMAALPGEFSAGVRRAPMIPAGAPPFAPLICYEIIFPDAVLPEGPRPGFLLNVTNDGWFGKTVGPAQHLHQARVRAVEEGLPLVRAANTGISVVTDPYGRIIARAALGERTMIEAGLPRALGPTPYDRLRDLASVFLIAGCILMALTRFLYRGNQV
jgi:apolipoprotein N-acyltransferase